MTEHNRTFAQQQHVESHAPYMTLFFVLLNFTAMEYFYAKFHGTWSLGPILLATAIVLTLLTAIAAAVFHLHFNRRWVYLTMVPALILTIFPVPLILGLLVLAITKATLVGMWFMHLKFEGRWVYYMLVPAGILAVVFVVALYPDMALQTTEQEQETQEEQLSRGPAPAFPPGVFA